MPAQFEGFGIRLLYPDSWTIDSDASVDSLSLESPDGSFLTITKFADSAEATAAVERAIAIMQEEYEEVEREPLSKTIAGISLAGTILRFVLLDLIVTSQLLAFAHGGSTYFVQTQAEDRDHDRLQPVFDAVLTSLCQNLLATEKN